MLPPTRQTAACDRCTQTTGLHLCLKQTRNHIYIFIQCLSAYQLQHSIKTKINQKRNARMMSCIIYKSKTAKSHNVHCEISGSSILGMDGYPIRLSGSGRISTIRSNPAPAGSHVARRIGFSRVTIPVIHSA